MKFFKLSKNHFPPIRLTYVGAFMLIATFVRCLSSFKGSSTEVFYVSVIIVVVGEPGESAAVEVDDQWIIGGAEGVYPHVEFPTSEEEGV